MDKQTVIPFWCRHCRIEAKLIATRARGTSFWGEEMWRAKCPKCKRVVRRGINNVRDPYYRTSLKVRGDRKKYADYLVQPGDPRFDVLYPHIKRQREEHYEKQEKEKWENRKNQR